MRVFAGPNGSGKSTMYQQVRSSKVDGRSIDLGIYVNPDDIAKQIRKTRRLDLGKFGLSSSSRVRFGRYLGRTTLIPSKLTRADARAWISWSGVQVHLAMGADVDRVAQLLTQFICDELLRGRKKFSFETVFSDPSKLVMMEKANALGYKVYLYFIATNDPEINIDRVKTRVEKGGHAVDPHIVEQRYYRSLDQLQPAIPLTYHSFLFDNSSTRPTMFAEYKRIASGPYWWLDHDAMPTWFNSYYLSKERAQDMRTALDKAVVAWALRTP